MSQAWTERLRARRHTVLLATIVAAFGVRPAIGHTRLATALFSVAVLAVLLTALYSIEVDDLTGERAAAVRRHRRRRIVAWTLAVPALLERALVTFAPSPTVDRHGTLSWMLFLGYVTWVELRSVLEQRRVTGETISMAISVYLLIGFTWGLLYLSVFLRDATSFHFTLYPGEMDPTADSVGVSITLFLYYSLTTLSTVGFGDITPVSLAARYASVAEAIVGQFYLAILVARLVSMQLATGASERR